METRALPHCGNVAVGAALGVVGHNPQVLSLPGQPTVPSVIISRNHAMISGAAAAVNEDDDKSVPRFGK